MFVLERMTVDFRQIFIGKKDNGSANNIKINRGQETHDPESETNEDFRNAKLGVVGSSGEAPETH